MKQIFHPFFRLIGQFDPDNITQRIGIEPTRVSRIGDPGPPDALGPRRGAEWVWQPEDDDSNDVADQLAFLAGSLSQRRDEVAELSKMFWGTFHVYEQFNRDWFLSSETLRLIGVLHVCIECVNLRSEQGKGAQA